MTHEMIVKDESSVGGLMVVIMAVVFIWIFQHLTKSLNQQEPYVPVTYARLLEVSMQNRTCIGKWNPMGTYNGSVLYERTYPSGKKAWRYIDEAGYQHYPRRREVFA
jgi:hypothetical protein